MATTKPETKISRPEQNFQRKETLNKKHFQTVTNSSPELNEFKMAALKTEANLSGLKPKFQDLNKLPKKGYDA